MTDTFDELRIIARDGGRLDLADRAKIAAAADELEQAWHMALDTHRALLEANAHRVALAEQLRETRQKLPSAPAGDLPWEVHSGWMHLQVL